MNPKEKDLAREEEYRDFEARDLDEGWPYDDAAGGASRSPENRPYGSTEANFDEATNKGYTVVDVDQAGEQQPQSDLPISTTRGLENADDLEERVTEALSQLKDIDIDSIDVHAHGRTIIIEGSVETIQMARRLVLCAEAVDGVHDVKSKLELTGLDAHMPDDEDD